MLLFRIRIECWRTCGRIKDKEVFQEGRKFRILLEEEGKLRRTGCRRNGGA